MPKFVKQTAMPCSAEELYAWHARPGAFERLTPPWEKVSVESRTGGIEDGARVTLRMGLGPTSVRWVAEHSDSIPGRQFRDVQIQGPFARWEHLHRFEGEGDTSTLVDDIDYELPLGGVGEFFGSSFVRQMLERTFAYRHRLTRADLLRHAALPGAPLRVLITGASGMVGGALASFLTTGGHSVFRVVRGGGAPKADEVSWDVDQGRLAGDGVEGADAVVHLAGENIAGARWTPAVKQRILDSRRIGTRRLCEALARLEKPPRVLISASAVGFYGDRGDAVVDEDSARGSGFLSDVCAAWEEATEPARAAGIRVVRLRIGVVLSGAGGALATMLPVFQMGVGGRVGSGEQVMSWIALDDLLGAILFALRRDDLEGAVNAVAPHPVTNAEFTRTLGGVLHRPTFFAVPAAAARLALGEMADEMLLAGARVAPTRLQAAGFDFTQTVLKDALRFTLGR